MNIVLSMEKMIAKESIEEVLSVYKERKGA